MTIVFYQRNASGDDVRLENVFSFTLDHSPNYPPMCGRLVVYFDALNGQQRNEEEYTEVVYLSVSK